MISAREENGVGHIVLERKDALNALNRELCVAIDEAARSFDRSPNVRAILISSSLKHFCAGADIREMAEMSGEEARSTKFIGCVEHIDKVSKPIVVAVNGLAAGGGCELVEMCDIVIAGESARFCHPEITLAAMPGAGGTQRLTRALGKHAALDMLLTGRSIAAREALALGLVSRVVADAELMTAANTVSSQIASLSSPVALRIKACALATQVGLAEGLVQERDSFHACFDEEDFREGLNAFMAKRKPTFLDR